ncbi:MAG TPA: hypothetical protein VHB97_02785, partial [Polyangia bacterium]|nr:hypothetical protein [Polyangia bacterium]
VPCLQHYDGAAIGTTSFTSSSNGLPDALDVIYASGTVTAVTKHSALTTTAPSVDVLDTCNFNMGDFVILTDKNYAYPALFQVSAVGGSGTCPAASPRAGTLSLGTLGAAPAVLPTVTDMTTSVSGTPVFKASAYSIFVVPAGGSTGGEFDNMLMIDSYGIASSSHTAYGTTTVQPAVEGVVDFQVAVGNDTSGDGIIQENTSSPASDEWIGNSWGETIPWNTTMAGTMPSLRQVRLGLVFQTIQQYGGTAFAVWSPSSGTTGLEDRLLTSYPSTTATYQHRFRSMRIVVAPRAWNLSE